MIVMRADRNTMRRTGAGTVRALSLATVGGVIAIAANSVIADAGKAASAFCADPYQPGCVLPRDEPDRRTIREQLADPVPDLVERPDKQRATISEPSYSLPGPPIFLDIQGPRGMGR